jgi:plastocyanin
MRTRIGWLMVVLLGATLGAAMFAAPAGASGGGGCGRPVTDARGTRVHIRNFCFTPTVLHVQRGKSVTFTNIDPFAHTVSGANVVWGSFDGLDFDKSVTYRFTRPGVYPYFCAIHVGMVGAIVVGNGSGRGDANSTTTQRGPVVLVQHPRPARAVRAAAASLPLSDGSGNPSWPLVMLIGIGLAAVAGLALLQLRQQMKS